MEFHVLGSLSVSRDGRLVPVSGAPKLQLTLAALLSKAGQPVSIDWLIAAVWGDQPPVSARRNIHLYIHQLRRAFGAHVLPGRPGGYAIITDSLDAARFRSLAAQGSAALDSGDTELARDRLRGALNLWRGPAFAEFVDHALIAEEARRLEEARLIVHERLAETELGLGRHVELAAELADLTRQHPYRESLRAHLMLALYRSGRQVEALEVFRRTRDLLNAQLGIEPGPVLQRLHEAMLRGDEDLLPAPGPPRMPAAPRATEGWAADDCPYQGLVAFQPEDEEWFFGRSQLVDRLRELVDRLPVVSVFGASGSGKSSLLRAGLLGTGSGEHGTAEAVSSGSGLIMTPGEHPLDTLADLVAKVSSGDPETLREELAGDPGALNAALDTALRDAPETRLLLVVDQFEETFTLCADDEERRRFVEVLLGMALGADRRTVVVLGIRADFLAHLTQHPGLVEALGGEAQLLVGPVSSADLREIVVRPAARAGLTVEPDLLATVLADAAEEPGNLPLVSHALLETWRNRTGPNLTLSAYQAAGGVRGAIAQSAERVYDELAPAEQQTARRIFVRLTALGDGTEDTRRPISRAELVGLADPEVTSAVLGRLAAARLVVLAEETVDVAHEALIRAWPRLHRWLTDDRENLFVHRRLTDAAQTWRELERDSGALYRGVQLLAARTWAEDHPQELNDVESAFLRASRVHGTEKPLVWDVASGAKVAALPVRHIHKLGFDSADGTLATGSSAHGVRFWRIAHDRVTALAALPKQSPYIWDMSAPVAGRIAVADENGLITVWDIARRQPVETYQDRSRAEALSLAFSADGSMLASAGFGRTIMIRERAVPPFSGHSRAVNDIKISPDGRVVASASSDRTVRLWDVRGNPIATLGDHPDDVRAVAFSPDGHRLATVTRSHIVTVWDVGSGRKLTRITYKGLGASTDIGFDPRGRFLVGTALGRFRWNLHDSKSSAEPFPGAPYIASALAFSPRDPLLATTSPAGDLLVWDLVQDRQVRALRTRQGSVLDVAYSPDGELIATAGADRTVKLWDARTGSPKATLTGHTAPIQVLAFSRDGRALASAGDDRTITVWDLPSGSLTATLTGHTAPIKGLAFSADGDLISGGDDGRIIRWSLRPEPLVGKLCREIGRDLTREEWVTYLPSVDYRPTC